MALTTGQTTLIRRNRRFLTAWAPLNLLLTTLAVAPPVEPVEGQPVTQHEALIRGKGPAPPWSAPNLLVSTLAPVVEVRPFAQTIWPNPLVSAGPHVGTVQNRPSYYVEPAPFAPLAWPNPVLPPAAAIRTGHSRSLITSEIVPPEPETIARGLIVGVPRRAAVPHVGTVSSRPAYYVEPVGVPLRPAAWPNPLIGAANPVEFVRSRPSFFVEPPNAGRQTDWPNPLIGGANAVGFVHGRPAFYVEPGTPGRPLDWPNPQKKAPQNVGSVRGRPLYYVEPMLRPLAWPNPLIGRANAVGFVYSRPSYYADPVLPVGRLRDWPNPLIGGANLVGFVQSRPSFFVEPPPAILPDGRLLDWPNPLIGGANLVGFVHQRPGYYFSEPAFAFHVDERPIRRLRRAPHLTNEDQWVFYTYLQLDLEAGLGADGAPCNVLGTDPMVMLRWSDDDGETWSNEYWVSAGQIGEYARRAIWRRLGRARDRIFEVTVSDPVPWHLIAAYLDIKPGRG